MSRRRATIATLMGGTANTLIVAIQSIVLTPLYMTEVGPQLYGAWLGSGDILLWLQAFDLGLPNLLIQRIGAAQARSERFQVGEYLAAGALVLAVVATVIGIAGYALSGYIPGWMGVAGSDAETLSSCFMVGVVATTIIIFNNCFVGYSRGIQDTALINASVVVASLVGFGVSLGTLMAGKGLWAIPAGLAARAIVSVSGSFVFLVLKRQELSGTLRLRTPILKELVIVSPPTALGGVSYALMNQSESALVAIFLRPELAAVLNITRKAADLIRVFVDMIGYATYGSFAHLVNSDQRHRALAIHAEIVAIMLSVSAILISVYISINKSFVSVWVDSEFYGGDLLTYLLAFQVVLSSGSYLLNYLYRGAGSVLKGSILLCVESLVRVPLMISMLILFGLPGVPLAAVLVSIVFAFIYIRLTRKDLAADTCDKRICDYKSMIGKIIVVLLGVFVSSIEYSATWMNVIMISFVVFVSCSLIVTSMDMTIRNNFKKFIGVKDCNQ